MKGIKLRTSIFVITVFVLGITAGCWQNGEKTVKQKPTGGKELLSVDLKKDQTLKYKFVSSRDVNVDWGQSKNNTGQGGQSSEVLEMVVSYVPVKVNPYGLSTIRATFESSTVRRSPDKGHSVDAAEYFSGKSFTFKVSPSGKIEDYSELETLIHQAGEKAFRPAKDNVRIKEPDMIEDVFATQWFLWDSISSIEKAADGVKTGQSWKSQLALPTPLLLRKTRDVTYTLSEIKQGEKGRLAVIQSTYSSGNTAPANWPSPYTGSFQISGTFGFLGMMCKGFNVSNIQGQGQELFNIDLGRTEQYKQEYQTELNGASPGLMGVNPKITIKQTLTMGLLEN
ncbi:MAG: hypothetical protein NTW55_04110 [Planctomycetota bacterium]|nr:hypothetical protein [Planctomycetota bacterium]